MFEENKQDTSIQGSNFGEETVSGHMPNPESDDDLLENAHAVGLRLDEDDEHPKPLNIAGDIRAAELERRNFSDTDEQ